MLTTMRYQTGQNIHECRFLSTTGGALLCVQSATNSWTLINTCFGKQQGGKIFLNAQNLVVSLCLD